MGFISVNNFVEKIGSTFLVAGQQTIKVRQLRRLKTIEKANGQLICRVT